MADGHDAPVVVDTGVFSAVVLPPRERTRELREQYAPYLLGRRLVLSFQTVAELRFGALHAGWGQKRKDELEQRVRRAHVVPFNDKLVWEYARIEHLCRTSGHGLAQKDHVADRWIAATALHMGLPLVAHDGIFRDVPGLALLTSVTA